MHTLLHRRLDRLFAEHVIGRNKTVDTTIRIHHQQQAHAALDHPAMGFIYGNAGENDDCGDPGEIGHHIDRRTVDTHALQNGLGGLCVAAVGLQCYGLDCRIVENHFRLRSLRETSFGTVALPALPHVR